MAMSTIILYNFESTLSAVKFSVGKCELADIIILQIKLTIFFKQNWCKH